MVAVVGEYLQEQEWWLWGRSVGLLRDTLPFVGTAHQRDSCRQTITQAEWDLHCQRVPPSHLWMMLKGKELSGVRLCTLRVRMNLKALTQPCHTTLLETGCRHMAAASNLPRALLVVLSLLLLPCQHFLTFKLLN